MSRIVHWNGRDLPEELRELPPGWYVVEDAADAPALTPEQEDGIRTALGALDDGKGKPASEVYQRLRARLSR